MSGMSESESFERVREGMKRASDRFRTMSVYTGDRTWTKIAFQIDNMLKEAEKEFKRVCPEAEVEALIQDMMNKHEKKNPEATWTQ